MLSLGCRLRGIGLYSPARLRADSKILFFGGILWNQQSTGLGPNGLSWKQFWRLGCLAEATIWFDFWLSFVRNTLTELSTKSRNTALLCKYWDARKTLIRRWIPLFG